MVFKVLQKRIQHIRHKKQKNPSHGVGFSGINDNALQIYGFSPKNENILSIIF